VKLSNDFNRTSAQMVGLGGVGAEQVEKWKDAMLELAPVVGKAPQELSEALYQISSSGAKASDALAILEASAKASSAGLGDTATVADAVTSAMNAYRQSGLSAAEATDTLVAAVREGKGEASDIAPVLGNVIPVASQLGVSFNDVAAAIASMSTLGFDAATASTNLSAVLSALLKPSKQAEEAFHKVGTSSKELREELEQKGLLATLRDMQDRFKGNDAAMAKAIPNIRALRGVLSLVGKSSENTDKVFQNMEDTTGSLGKAFSAVADQDGFKLDQSMAKIQASAIEMGDALAPVLSDMASGFAKAADLASDHEQATRVLGSAIAGLSVVLIGANSGLRVYNSSLVTTLRLQSALRGALIAGGWASAVAGIALVVHEGLDVLHERLNAEPAIFQEAEDAARSYRQALTDLNSTAEQHKDDVLRLKQAHLSEEATQRAARKAIDEYGRASLEARQAILNHKEALRELEKAEKAETKSKRENIDAGQRVGIGIRRTSNAIAGLEEHFGKLTKGIDRSNEANATLLRQLDQQAVAGFTEKVRKLAAENGGLETKAGRAALAVADLATKLGRIPTKTEINLVTNADHTRDQIERLRSAVASVPRTNIVDFFIRTHGSAPGSTPTGIAEGAGASGAIVNRPTLALIGEHGREAVVPLSRTRGNGPLPAGGITLNINGPVYGPSYRELADKLINPLNQAWARRARSNGGLA
jgi:TP901 family phage tail tape measure protein